MNVVRLMGGIGNQLFQYAFGKVQSLNGATVRYDTSWYVRHAREFRRAGKNARPLRLEFFNIPPLRVVSLPDIPIIKERSFDRDMLTSRDHIFHGYWQYLDYYRDVIPLFQKEFRVKEQHYTHPYIRLQREITEQPSVGVHVRRGDYLEKGHTVLPITYYTEALKQVEGRVFVFSDDIPWCRENFTDATFIDKLDDYLAWDLLRQCTHKVISNSTFSWWPAVLTGGTVVAPHRWIVRKEDEHSYDNRRHYPDEWIRVKTDDMLFDVLVVVAEKDFTKLPFVIDSIQKNIRGFSKLYCVSNEPVPDHLRREGVGYFLDMDVVKFDFNKINLQKRRGWYRQQMIKLFQNITVDNYLSVDADVIVNKPLEPLLRGKPVFFFGKDQHHVPYFDLMQRVFGLGREYPHSFISEMMFFKRSVIQHLLSTYNFTADGFFARVMAEVNRQSHPSGFSEFELYGNYVMKHFKDLYQIKQLNTEVNGKHAKWTEAEIRQQIAAHSDKDIISMHTWI